MRTIILLTAIAAASMAGNVEVHPGSIERDGDWLYYDNGSPEWLSWDGTYRGVWFNINDFVPGGGSGPVPQCEFWFYHHSSYPWDTSDVSLELWNGGVEGPQVLLAEDMVTALHYSPVYADFSPAVAEPEFWALANTELSAGGWPSILGDGAQGTVYHSFFSDDFISWEPWDIDGACNYFVSAQMGESLAETTWAGIKAVF
ncbi:MAG TPA: hypothetical protein PK991_05980 [Candidatus Sabulitectum sp.]|nr:hypothetical protein [Candidatus Sabulitectum sp.]HPR22232.1 hypothetical protein [Candidatus Sabulitectum sp.]